MADNALHLVACQHSVGELERLRAPQRLGGEALQFAACCELGGDALENPVAHERSCDFLG